MSHEGRTHVASVPESELGGPSPDRQGAAGAANESRRDALRKLIAKGHYLRRTDGDYGRDEDSMSNAMARDLKAKKYAVPGFNNTMYPTAKGRKFVEER